MRAVIAVVGRPNVGKSTLFNCLTKSRDALVADFPGLTCDRQYGQGKIGKRPFLVVDTGGLGSGDEVLSGLMAGQAMRAAEEADVILFLVDGRAGRTADDECIAGQLRALGKPVLLVVNKIDGIDPTVAVAEFYPLGLGEPMPIAAAHGRGVARLMDVAFSLLPELAMKEEAPAALVEGIAVAIVGRPNVGKSTLVNCILGEERVIVSELPGTTRDSIYVPFSRLGQAYTLIDTAGVRRRGKITQRVEKYSVVKTLQAVEEANIVVLVLDARQGIGHQDAVLLGFVLESGRGLVIAVNKWDGLTREQRQETQRALSLRLSFLDFAKIHLVSALHGTGVGEIFASINRAHASAIQSFSTTHLTRILEEAVQAHPPPLVRGRRIKLRYAHQGGRNPPLIVVHGNQTEAVPDAYRRFLRNRYLQALGLEGTPLRIEFKTGENPFRNKKNVLSPRQQKKRKRMLRFVKKGKHMGRNMALWDFLWKKYLLKTMT
jgi:GTP-binding protein